MSFTLYLKSSEAIQYISVINRLKSLKKGTFDFYSATMWLILTKCGTVFHLETLYVFARFHNDRPFTI